MGLDRIRFKWHFFAPALTLERWPRTFLELNMRRLLQSTIQTGSSVVVLGGVLLACVLLRLLYLGQKSFWLDEMWSVGFARLPWRSLMSVIAHQEGPNMSLYYTLLHFWIGLGDGEAWVRLLSVLLGVATIPVFYVLGKRLCGSRTGLIASLLLAINGMHIWASQEARAYSLVAFLSTLSSLFFVSCVTRPMRANWLGYVATTALAIYGHMFAALVPISHWGSLMFLRRKGVPWKGLLNSTAMIGVLASPMGLFALGRARRDFPIGWVPKPTWHSIYEIFHCFVGACVGGTSGKSVVGAYFIICAVSLFAGVKLWRASRNSFETWRVGFLFTWFLLPIGLAFAVSIVTPIVVPQYLIICLPPFLLVAANGIQSIKPRFLAGAALAATMALSALVLRPYYQLRPRNQTWKTATDYLVLHTRPGDAALFFPAPGRLLYDYYRGRYGHDGSAGNLDVVYPELGEDLVYMPPVRGELLDYVTSHYHRVWIVLYPHSDWREMRHFVSQRILERPSARYRKIEECLIEGETRCKIESETEKFANLERMWLLLYANGGADR